ncbi:hypothetical protein GCM10027589_12080 [Actinocorallia lasiicapitis]
MASSPPAVEQLARQFLATVMTNPLRGSDLTCDLCCGPVPERYSLCWRCKTDRDLAFPVAARVVPLTYAHAGGQADNDLYRYKDPMKPEERLEHPSFQRLLVLLYGFAVRHAPCLDRVAGRPVTRLALVPSLSGRIGRHPLNELVKVLPRHWTLVTLRPTDVPESERRSTLPSHFRVDATAGVAGRHVVVLDDTWVQGGHAQSAAAALLQAGAAEVTVVVLSRRVDTTFKRDALKSSYDVMFSGRPYSVEICPVTGGPCP